MRSTLLAVIVVILSLTASPAAASTSVSVEAGVLMVVAAPAETNELEVRARTPGGTSTPTEWAVQDTAGASPGPGCAADSQGVPGTSVVCPIAGVQRILVRLGDGNDSATYSHALLPAAFHGDGGDDRVTMFGALDSVSEGGEGNDELLGGDDVRGGPGDDRVTGSRLLDGGEGNDVLQKRDGKAGARLTGGPGDDSLDSSDSQIDDLSCGPGTDVIAASDDDDRNDGTCESGKGAVAPPPRVFSPQVTVFELRNMVSRPGRDGRLAVWLKCTVANCAVTVRIFFVGSPGIRGYRRFRNPPSVRLVVGTTPKLFRLRLSGAQRRGLRGSDVGSGVGAVVVTQRPGPDAKMQTDGLYCRRDDPCRPSRG